MAVTTQTVVLEFDAKTGEVLKATGQLQKSMDDVAQSAEDAAEATSDIGKNAKSAGTGLKKAGTLGAQGFKALGTAIKATGIGLLVGIVVKLTQKMTENKKIAEALEVVFNGLGVVFNVLVEALTPLGDLLISAFTEPQQAVETLRGNLIALKDYFGTLLDTAINPVYRGLLNLQRGFYEAAIASKEFLGLDASELKQSVREIDEQLADLVVKQEENKEALAEPWKEATQAIKGYVDEAKTAVTQSTALTKQQQALRDAQRELNVATAQGAAEVEELKRQSDDQRLSIEQRIDAATRAAELNKKFADENVAISQQRAELLREEIRLQGETEERLEALAQAEIEAANARQASATIQTELQNKLFALNQELITQEEERLAAEEEARIAREEGLAEEQKLKDKAAAEDLARAERLAEQEKRIEQAKKDVRDQTLNALLALNEAFAGDTEEQQKKAFERSKTIQSAQTLISTYESAVQAFKSLAGIPVVGPGLGAAAAAAATAAGLANVKQIQSQQYQSASAGGGGAGYSSAGSSPASGAQQAPTAPTLDLSFLGQGAGQSQPIQAYVLAENVSNAQQANQKIQDQATL